MSVIPSADNQEPGRLAAHLKPNQTIFSVFTNSLGEDWILLFDIQSARARISGSDVDWQQHPVYDGITEDFLLNREECTWLKTVWQRKRSTYDGLRTYGALPARFQQRGAYCLLSDDVCPLCLRQKAKFDLHHCIASQDGGPDSFANILRICHTCHLLLTVDDSDMGWPRERAAFFHQVMYFGIGALPDLESHGARHQEIRFFDRFPQLRHAVGLYRSSNKEEQHNIDREIRASGRFLYQKFRDIGLGLWPAPQLTPIAS